MLTIPRGRYPVRPSLTVHLDGPLELSPGRFWIIAGDNGTGKTSFVKAVVLPRVLEHLRRSRPTRPWWKKSAPAPEMTESGLLLYVDQEFGLQYYSVKAHAAAAGHETGAGFGFPASLEYLAGLYDSSRDDDPASYPDLYVVCDETETFGSLERLLARLSGRRVTTVAVTHAPERLPAGPDRWRLTFTRATALTSCAVPTPDPVS